MDPAPPPSSDPRPDVQGSPAAPAEPRQRWRIVFARDEPSDVPHRRIAEAWMSGLAECGLPLPRSEGRPRPFLAFAAPLPVGVAAERELADLWLAELRPVAEVREALRGTMPNELRLAELYDVWLGEPALAAALVAADYRLSLADPPVPLERLAETGRELLAAPTLERERARGAGRVRYDLRPLLDDVHVDVGPPPLLRIRTRFHPERGTGRPEEVVAALSERLGAPVAVAGIVRERLILAREAEEARVG